MMDNRGAMWLDDAAVLDSLSVTDKEQLLQAAQFMELPYDAPVFSPGDTPPGLVMVLSGRVRVQQITESGREIVLYRLAKGESCILTTSCLLSGETYSAEARTESEVRCVVIPHGCFEMLLGCSAAFRSFVFKDYAKRITELLLIIEEVAFKRMDQRLLQKLRDLANDEKEVVLTHQQLAVELGTAREVVTRLLKDLQRKGLVELRRGGVKLLS